MRKLMLLLALVILSATIVAFDGITGVTRPGTVEVAAATVDETRATEIADAAFEAFDEGDYAGWTEHWSGPMRSAIPEDAFQGWRSSVIEQLGGFVSLGAPVRSSRQSGTYRWSFPVTFERGTASIGFGFAEGRDEVEGVFVE